MRNKYLLSNIVLIMAAIAILAMFTIAMLAK